MRSDNVSTGGCSVNANEDPEVFAATREERMMPVEEKKDAPTFGRKSLRASPAAGTARAIRLMSSSTPLSQEELEEQKKLMAIFKKEHPGFDFSEVSEEDQRRLWNKTVPMNQWTEEQKKKKSEQMKTVIWSRSSSSKSDLLHPVWNDPHSEMSRLIQKNSTEERSERSKMSESMKDIDEQAFWSPCQIQAPQDMVLRMAAEATGRQYGGYWTNPPLPEGEIQENQRMEAAVGAVKNRKEESESKNHRIDFEQGWCGIHYGWKSCCAQRGCPANPPSEIWVHTVTPCADLLRKKEKERQEKFQVLRERPKPMPLEGPQPEPPRQDPLTPPQRMARTTERLKSLLDVFKSGCSCASCRHRSDRTERLTGH